MKSSLYLILFLCSLYVGVILATVFLNYSFVLSLVSANMKCFLLKNH